MTRNYEWAGPNANIAEVLHKYCYGKSKLPFALMLDGTWGCGKTWFVKRFFEEKQQAGTRHECLYLRFMRRFFEEKQKGHGSDSELGMIYVSLYGIQNTEEITKAIYTAMHPILGGKVGELGKVVFKGLLKSTLKIDLHHLEHEKADLSAVLGIPDNTGNKGRTFENRILVFDDVERAKMPVSDILALVQPLVESLENRIILIANEKEIATDSEIERKKYERIKEKTVYLTLHLTPDIKSAWNESLTNLPKGPFKDFLTDRTEDFISFIKGTKQQNFRLLHFFMNFGKDLFPSLKAGKHQAYDNIDFDILCLLYGLIIEKNIHRRTSHQLHEILPPSSAEKKKEDKSVPYSNTSDNNYFNILKIYNSLHKVIYDFIESGTLDKEEFENKISYFLRCKETPIWKKLSTFHFEKPSPEHYDSLIKEFSSYLEEKTAENDGEFLHVCDIYHMLEKANINEFNNKNSSGLLKEYTLRYYGTLSENASLLSSGNRYLDIKDLRCLGFMEENLKEIKKINDKLFQEKDTLIRENNKKHYDKTIENCHPSEIMELFSGLSAPMTDSPFIHTINPDKFLTCMDQLPSGLDQHKIYQELHHRFQKAKRIVENSETDEATKSSWQDEREWFEKIINKLQQKADAPNTHPFIRKLTEDHLKTLGKVHEESSDQPADI